MAAHALAQSGVFTRKQAHRAGASSRAISRRVTSGRWCIVLPGVYRFAGTPPTERMRLQAAVLWGGAGAVISHVAAARLYGFKYLGGVPAERVEIAVGPGRRLRHAGIAVHRTRTMAERDRRTKSGLPVTTPARTLLDIADLFDRDQLERILEGALRDQLVTLGELKARIKRLGRSGRRGVEMLASIVERRSPDEPMTDSEGERVFREAVKEIGLPPPSHVHHSYSNEKAGLWTEMDYFWEDIGLNVEIDHPYSHGQPQDIEEDRARDNALMAAGVTVMRITHDQLQSRLPRTMLHLAEVMRRLYAPLGERDGSPTRARAPANGREAAPPAPRRAGPAGEPPAANC